MRVVFFIFLSFFSKFIFCDDKLNKDNLNKDRIRIYITLCNIYGEYSYRYFEKDINIDEYKNKHKSDSVKYDSIEISDSDYLIKNDIIDLKEIEDKLNKKQLIAYDFLYNNIHFIYDDYSYKEAKYKDKYKLICYKLLTNEDEKYAKFIDIKPFYIYDDKEYKIKIDHSKYKSIHILAYNVKNNEFEKFKDKEVKYYSIKFGKKSYTNNCSKKEELKKSIKNLQYFYGINENENGEIILSKQFINLICEQYFYKSKDKINKRLCELLDKDQKFFVSEIVKGKNKFTFQELNKYGFYINSFSPLGCSITDYQKHIPGLDLVGRFKKNITINFHVPEGFKLKYNLSKIQKASFKSTCFSISEIEQGLAIAI